MNKAILLLAAEETLETHEGWRIFFYSAIVFVLIALLVIEARKGLKEKIPRNIFTQLAEHLYHFVDGLCTSVIGLHGRKYVPYIMALWLYIFVSNCLGLIFAHTPTADWSLNFGLSITTLLYVQYEGIRANGLWGHLTHFAGPKLPVLMAIFITPLVFSIEIVSEMIKMATLSLRLFLNIDSGHMIVDTLNNLAWEGQWPIGGILFPIKLLSAVIQAYVFVMLTCVYFSLVTSHGSEEEEFNSQNLEESGLQRI